MTKRKEKYALDARPLAIGGQAEVFRAKVKQTGEFVALKRIRNRFNNDALARMRREIEVQTEINHPNVMPILDYSDSFVWYTMPLAIKTVQDLQPPINDDLLIAIVTCVAEGLIQAHSKGFIHRDLKPSNILLLDRDNDRWVVSDWGLVRKKGQTTEIRTSQGFQFGTAGYAPPELWIDAHTADARADVYSLGRVVAWCLTGEPLIQNIPLIPDGIWSEFIRNTTELNRSERMNNMEVVLEIIESIKQILSSEKNEIINSFDPIKIINIIYDDITEPINNGTRGSALYSIPFKLSRFPTSYWIEYFIKTWKNPPRFTPMHRKGIAKVIGDTIVLDGTTIEEVKKYHLETLNLSIERANVECQKLEKNNQEKEAYRLRKTQSHKENVRKIARDLKFD